MVLAAIMFWRCIISTMPDGSKVTECTCHTKDCRAYFAAHPPGQKV